MLSMKWRPICLSLNVLMGLEYFIRTPVQVNMQVPQLLMPWLRVSPYDQYQLCGS